MVPRNLLWGAMLRFNLHMQMKYAHTLQLGEIYKGGHYRAGSMQADCFAQTQPLHSWTQRIEHNVHRESTLGIRQCVHRLLLCICCKRTNKCIPAAVGTVVMKMLHGKACMALSGPDGWWDCCWPIWQMPHIDMWWPKQVDPAGSR
jgi:hypothetical protein